MAAMKTNGHRWTSFVVYGKWNTETALTLLLHTPPHYGPEVGLAAAETALYSSVCALFRGGGAAPALHPDSEVRLQGDPSTEAPHMRFRGWGRNGP